MPPSGENLRLSPSFRVAILRSSKFEPLKWSPDRDRSRWWVGWILPLVHFWISIAAEAHRQSFIGMLVGLGDEPRVVAGQRPRRLQGCRR